MENCIAENTRTGMAFSVVLMRLTTPQLALPGRATGLATPLTVLHCPMGERLIPGTFPTAVLDIRRSS